MTDLATLQASLAASGLRTAGPFPTPSAALRALGEHAADDFDQARWTAVRLADAGILLVADEGCGLPADIAVTSLADLADRRERSDLLAVLRSAGLPGHCKLLWDAENFAYFASPGAAEAWLLRRRDRNHELEPLRAHGLWASRGDRGVVILAADEGGMLQVSFLLRKKGILPQFVRDLAPDRQLPFPKTTPPFDPAIAAELADRLQEVEPGPRRSIEKYVAYLGAHRCRQFAGLAIELHGNPTLPLDEVWQRMAAQGWDAAALASAEPVIDPRVSLYGPRTLGGVWFHLMSRWIGPRLAGWVEKQR